MDTEPDPALARKMLGIGLPMGLQFSITAIGSVVVQWSVNGLGVSAVASISAAVKISMFFACVFDAMASTMATYATQLPSLPSRPPSSRWSWVCCSRGSCRTLPHTIFFSKFCSRIFKPLHSSPFPIFLIIG